MKQPLNGVIIDITKPTTKPIAQRVTTIGVLLIVSSFTLAVLAQDAKDIKEDKAAMTVSSKQAPVVIETQVKGSQEQPTVIYILPWQGIDTPIIIEGEHAKIAMPNFKPINPKQFKKQATQLHNLHFNNDTENSTPTNKFE